MGKITLPEVVDQFAAYHDRNPAWGNLHIVLDDGNVDDQSVKYCLESARGCGDAEGVRLAEVLLKMSKTQRLKLGHAATTLNRDLQ